MRTRWLYQKVWELQVLNSHTLSFMLSSYWWKSQFAMIMTRLMSLIMRMDNKAESQKRASTSTMTIIWSLGNYSRKCRKKLRIWDKSKSSTSWTLWKPFAFSWRCIKRCLRMALIKRSYLNSFWILTTVWRCVPSSLFKRYQMMKNLTKLLKKL